MPIVSLLPVTVMPFDGAAAVRAGLMHRVTGGRNLSLGDRACLGLAADLRLPVPTIDRAWLDLALAIEIQPLR